MEKIIIAIAIFSVSYLSNAQQVSFVTQNDTISAEIQAYGEDRFITSEGYITFDDVWVVFYHDETADDYLVKITGENNIVLTPSNNSIAFAPETVTHLNTNRSSSNTNTIPNPTSISKVPDFSIEGEDLNNLQKQINDLEYRIENFRIKRSAGFGLQAAGTGLLILSISSESNELAIMGTFLNVIGWVVNWGSGKELRKKGRY